MKALLTTERYCNSKKKKKQSIAPIPAADGMVALTELQRLELIQRKNLWDQCLT